MNISLCITNFNRTNLLFESYEKVLNDERITEIVIVDDCSDFEKYREVAAYVKTQSKVVLYRNETNLGILRNKYKSVALARNEWCILFDSDNVIDSSYLDALDKYSPLSEDVIYCPSFARPGFDYRMFSGVSFSKTNVSEYAKIPMFCCLLNTCNYVVNKENYLSVNAEDDTVKASDTIFFNYLWMKKDFYLHVVPNMEYEHRVHQGSGFLQDSGLNMKKADEVKQLMVDNVW